MSNSPYSAWQMRQFSRQFRAGAVFGYPTESVFGLGCDPLNQTAVERIRKIKQRAAGKGLILLASELGQLLPWIALEQPSDRERLSAPCQRPTTWVVPASAEVPRWIRGGYATVAVRLTQFAPVVQLCETVGSALVSTSANRAGSVEISSAVKLRYLLGNQLDVIFSGETGGVERPSEIRDFYRGTLLRGG
jgi:L-threonylcarbamoyladenylate synthase